MGLITHLPILLPRKANVGPVMMIYLFFLKITNTRKRYLKCNFSILFFFYSSAAETTPGPSAYKPEQCPLANHMKSSPAFSMCQKGSRKPPFVTPGANAYSLPTCLGPKLVDKRAKAAHSM